ncbi:MAG: hypothetical protein JNM85_02900 [Chthonomonas sp.]|nr:hypothetical protein [Chthonomonas sp.]
MRKKLADFAPIEILGAEDAFKVLQPYAMLPAIHVVVGCVDGRSQLFSLEIVHIGSEEEYVFSPALIYAHVTERRAFGFFVGISHPSGSPVATPSDIFNARRLKEQSDFVGAPLMDVITFGVDEFVSLKENEFA